MLTVYGIETDHKPREILQEFLVATVLTVYSIETTLGTGQPHQLINELQQYLPFTVCAEGCEAAEEQSDDEIRTSQVPERSEGKTKIIK